MRKLFYLWLQSVFGQQKHQFTKNITNGIMGVMILGTAYFVLRNTLEGQLQQISQPAYEVATIFMSRMGGIFAGMFVALSIDTSTHDSFREFFHWQNTPEPTLKKWLLLRKVFYFLTAALVSIFVLSFLFPLNAIGQTATIFLVACASSFIWFKVSRNILSTASTALPENWQYVLLRLKLYSSEKFFFFLGILLSILVIYAIYINGFESIHAHYLFALVVGLIVAILQASDVERQLKSSWLDILSGKTHQQFVAMFALSGSIIAGIFGLGIWFIYSIHVGEISANYNLILLPLLPPLFTAVLLFQIDPAKTIVLISLVTLVSLFLGSLCILHPLGYLGSMFMISVAASQQQHRLYPYVGERVT